MARPCQPRNRRADETGHTDETNLLARTANGPEPRKHLATTKPLACAAKKKAARPKGRTAFYDQTVFQFRVRAVSLDSSKSNLFELRLLAGANRAGQAAEINSIGTMPQRQAKFDALAKLLNLGHGARRGIRRLELIGLLRHEVFVVPVLQDRLKNVAWLHDNNISCREKTLVAVLVWVAVDVHTNSPLGAHIWEHMS